MIGINLYLISIYLFFYIYLLILTHQLLLLLFFLPNYPLINSFYIH